MIRFANNVKSFRLACFCTKKQYDKGLLKVSKAKLDETIGGHLIYQSQKSKHFFVLSMVILSGVGISIMMYQMQSTASNFIPLLISLSSAVFFQMRVFNTVRKIIIQKSGQIMRIQRYGILGSEFFSTTLVTPIYLMRGIHKKSINRGVRIEGGGVYGYESFKYYFHSAGVKDKIVFDAVMSGTCIKYVDKL